MRDEFYPLVTKRRNFDSKDKSDSFFTIVNCPFVTPKWRPSISCSVRKWLLGVVRRLFSISPFGQETKCSLVFFATHTVKWTPKMAGWSIGEKEKVFPSLNVKRNFFWRISTPFEWVEWASQLPSLYVSTYISVPRSNFRWKVEDGPLHYLYWNSCIGGRYESQLNSPASYWQFSSPSLTHSLIRLSRPFGE